MSSLFRRLICFALMLLPALAQDKPADIARDIIAPLVDPAKVATLKGDRPANARLYKVLYWLEVARRDGATVADIIDKAQTHLMIEKTLGAAADRKALLWAHDRLTKYGCFTVEGMEKMKRGGSPKITLGEHAGDSIALDHVLPCAVVPELEARFYNLEPVPAAVNRAKSAKITQREIDLARHWHKSGLLSAAGLAAVERAMD
jgi:hypothetical protein